MINKTTVLCCLAALCAAGTAQAQLHATDIALRIENGRIETGRIVSGAPVFPASVFTSELGLYGIPAATFDPGFDSATGAFPASTPVGITVRRALREWDGQGFSAIPPEQLDIIRNTTIVTPPVDPADCGPGPSLEVALTTSTGRIHVHPAYQLHIGGGPPTSGTYLVEFDVWFGAPGQGVSDPVFVLFSHNEDPAVVAAAAAWAEANLVRTCYANCDGSTVEPALNVDDFTCFINAFAAGDCYANCDGSTTAPVLNVDDFTCFINAFAQGCP